METTQSALTQLELLWKELEGVEETDSPLGLQRDALSPIQIEAIRRIYACNAVDREIITVSAKKEKRI